MAYLSLYRQYRPQTFESLIGQDHIVKTLTNQIETGRIGHAYLFTGTRGTGKTSCAKIFAKAVNCESNVNGSPCGKCPTCLALSDSSNIDIIEIDAASNNGVNEIRDLREKVQYPPVNCKYKVYIIDEVHMLTGAAFNALLKTLEEPPKHAIFILATTEVHKIPATILSRCMRFDFHLVSTDEIASLISGIYDKLGKKYEKEAVYQIALAGEGSVRDALSIADIALSYNSDTLTYKDVTEILGSSNSEVLQEFVKNVLEGNAGKVIESIDSLCSFGKSMGVLNKDLTNLVRDLLVIKTCSNPNGILNLPQDKFNVLSALVSDVSSDRLIRILDIFANTENSLKYSTHPRIVFETSAVKACRPETDFDYDAILARIKDLEVKIENGCFKIKNPVENEKDVQSNVGTNNITLSSVELKGKILLYLKQNGEEMLWNIMQNVDLDLNGKVIRLTAKNDGDLTIISKQDSVKALENSVYGLGYVLEFNSYTEEKKISEVEDELEKIKRIFGEDIIVSK